MTDTELQLLIDLHIENQRQGPGSTFHTLQALALSRFETQKSLQIADIGSGTGASTLALLSHTQSKITAVDFLQPFLDKLIVRANIDSPNAMASGRLDVINASMEDLPFCAEQFDLIWSEGAIYNIGFKKGIESWRHFLKADGKMVISEITWLTETRPAQIEAYWQEIYPEINTASQKIDQIKEAGYRLIGYFELPSACWIDNYYLPLKQSIEQLEKRVLDKSSERGESLVKLKALEQEEFTLYKKYHEYYSYGVYIMQKA